MDNTIFSGITGDVTGILAWALASAATLAVLILGPTVGYRVFRRFLG